MKTTHTMAVYQEDLTRNQVEVKETKKSILKTAIKWVVTLLRLNSKYGVIK